MVTFNLVSKKPSNNTQVSSEEEGGPATQAGWVNPVTLAGQDVQLKSTLKRVTPPPPILFGGCRHEENLSFQFLFLVHRTLEASLASEACNSL